MRWKWSKHIMIERWRNKDVRWRSFLRWGTNAPQKILMIRFETKTWLMENQVKLSCSVRVHLEIWLQLFRLDQNHSRFERECVRERVCVRVCVCVCVCACVACACACVRVCVALSDRTSRGKLSSGVGHIKPHTLSFSHTHTHTVPLHYKRSLWVIPVCRFSPWISVKSWIIAVGLVCRCCCGRIQRESPCCSGQE